MSACFPGSLHSEPGRSGSTLPQFGTPRRDQAAPAASSILGPPTPTVRSLYASGSVSAPVSQPGRGHVDGPGRLRRRRSARSHARGHRRRRSRRQPGVDRDRSGDDTGGHVPPRSDVRRRVRPGPRRTVGGDDHDVAAAPTSLDGDRLADRRAPTATTVHAGPTTTALPMVTLLPPAPTTTVAGVSAGG